MTDRLGSREALASKDYSILNNKSIMNLKLTNSISDQQVSYTVFTYSSINNFTNEVFEIIRYTFRQLPIIYMQS